MRRLFILRPEPGASASAGRARAAGLEPVVAPLFRIVPVRWQAPDAAEFDALLVTSANAVRCAGPQLAGLAGLPVHAIGEASAAAAREAGLEVASIGGSDVRDLLGAVEAQARLLHLCGEHRRPVGEAPQRITRLVVYRAEALERPEALEGIGGQVAALHSPRAGERLAELVPDGVRRSVRLAAISDSAAAAAGGGWARVEAAGAPSDEALLAIAIRLCEDGR